MGERVINRTKELNKLRAFKTEATIRLLELRPHLHPQVWSELSNFLDSYAERETHWSVREELRQPSWIKGVDL